MIPAELIVFPPVESVAITRLREALFLLDDDAHVTDTIPDDRPDRMVKVTAGGPSSRRDLVTAIRSAIFECWDADRDRASRLAEMSYAIVMATTGLVGEDHVKYVTSVGEPTFFPDPLTDLPRYQFTCSFALAGATI